MNIKVAAFTVREKSSNTWFHYKKENVENKVYDQFLLHSVH